MNAPVAPTSSAWLQPFERDLPAQRIAAIQSAYQLIEVWEVAALGRVFTLDGRPMTATGDEFIYHECMSHPAALAHPAPQRALILGGGDGGAARELLRHPSLAQIVIAELDPDVVAVARRYFPSVHHNAFDHPRVALHLGDAAAYVRQSRAQGDASFDLAVFDLTPPDSPARGLFSVAFLLELKEILTGDGNISVHLGSPTQEPARVAAVLSALRAAFSWVRVMHAEIPLYGGPWAMAVAGDAAATDPAKLDHEIVAARLQARDLGALRYYNAARHRTLFTEAHAAAYPHPPHADGSTKPTDAG